MRIKEPFPRGKRGKKKGKEREKKKGKKRRPGLCNLVRGTEHEREKKKEKGKKTNEKKKHKHPPRFFVIRRGKGGKKEWRTRSLFRR